MRRFRSAFVAQSLADLYVGATTQLRTQLTQAAVAFRKDGNSVDFASNNQSTLYLGNDTTQEQGYIGTLKELYVRDLQNDDIADDL